MTNPLLHDTVWLQQPKFEEAESAFQRYLICGNVSAHVPNGGIGNHLEQRIHHLEEENNKLKQTVEELRKMISSLSTQLKTSEKAKEDKMEVDKEEDEDECNLFDDDDEDDEEAEKLRQERLKAYAEKKAKKPAVIAKSSVTIDVKPWDDETDMQKLEECVRSIQMDGLLWGASKLVPLAYGIKKLTIVCVIEDDKVSLEDLEDLVVAFEDHVQSMDIAAFQKI